MLKSIFLTANIRIKEKDNRDFVFLFDEGILVAACPNSQYKDPKDTLTPVKYFKCQAAT